MPDLFKIRQKRYVDSEGKRCKKSKPGARERIVESKVWFVDLPDQDNPGKRKRHRLCNDKRAARRMLDLLLESEDKKSAGIKDYQSFANQSLGSLIKEFENHLQTSKKRSEEYIETTIARIGKVIDGCDFRRLSDVSVSAVNRWLASQRDGPSSIKRKVKGSVSSYREIADAFNVSVNTVSYWRSKGAPIVPRSKSSLSKIAKWYAEFTKPRSMSSTTSDHYVTALKLFGGWMVRPGKVSEVNPFYDLDKLNDETDLRKKRRALCVDEFSSLIAGARASTREFRGLSGIDRSLLYTFAAYTGLRASEISSLTNHSFSFGSPPYVVVEAAYAKNGELAEVPLRSDLAIAMQAYIESRGGGHVWPGNWWDDAAEMMRIDLELAGIPYRDNRGYDYDFHSLRHQFITQLSRSGVTLRSAQELARHSKPELTANVYTHLSIRDTVSDVEKLPPIPSPKSAKRKRLG